MPYSSPIKPSIDKAMRADLQPNEFPKVNNSWSMSQNSGKVVSAPFIELYQGRKGRVGAG
jgi:hypothetical protein